MNTVTFEVRSLADSLSDFSQSWKTGSASGPRISFETPELLWKVLTAKRWEILKVMSGAGPISMREVSRLVNRDVKSVHSDIHALLSAGIINMDARKYVFPYDAVHVDFMLMAG